MPSFLTGTVTSILDERRGLQRVEVGERRAYVLTQLIGAVAVGDRVVINTTAVDLNLGTGGWDVVHWNLERESWSEPGPGHIMKLRYTSLQADTGSAEDTEGYRAPESLDGRPVVAFGVHSQLAPVAIAFKHRAPNLRLAYVMTDAGSLPLALSDLVHDLCERGLIDVTLTSGHAFGGDYEAVNPRSALDVAVASAEADAIAIGTGPGVVGTQTPRGHSALEVASLLDHARDAGGQPVAVVRWSDGEDRPRHRGVSHHTMQALSATHSDPLVPFPEGFDLTDYAIEGTAFEVPELDYGAVTTMGRTADDDPGFFTFAAAAGIAAARIAAARLA